jgi:anti-sigma regulatory factor (Ser/Thr protein kinase)
MDGVLSTSIFAAILLPFMGIRGMYSAEVLNGISAFAVVWIYAAVKNRRFPGNVADLLVMPDSFGVPEENRMDLTVRSMAEVITISEEIYAFCDAHGMDRRRSFFGALAMEEMAGNVVLHGFSADRKKHSADVRVSIKEDDLILRIKDDCIPFDPVQFEKIMDPEDPAGNIGIRLVFRISKNYSYQNILGLNVLTVRI